MDKNPKNQEGFILLLVILLISVILVIGLGVFDIVLREILISGIGRESQKAFYAADSALECARYWERRTPSAFNAGLPFMIYCNGDLINGDMTSGSPSINAELIEVNFDNGSCALVRIMTGIPPSGSTQITSWGYNVGCSDDNQKKVERGVRVSY